MTTGMDELVASWQGENVNAASVERALSLLLRELKLPAADGSPHAPARTSVLSLIVRLTGGAHEKPVAEALSHLYERHPLRTVILSLDAQAPQPGLDAWATAHCHLHPGRSARVCFEQVQIRARGLASVHLASVVAPLLVPDLPAALWWLGDIPGPAEELLRLCDHLILDAESVGLAGLTRLVLLEEALVGLVSFGDLAWSGLGPWREVIAQLFDPEEARPYQRTLTHLRIEYVAGASAVLPFLLLGWLGHSLDWVPELPCRTAGERDFCLRFHSPVATVDVEVIAVPPSEGFLSGGLRAVTLASQPEATRGDPATATFAIARDADGECAELRVTLPGQATATRTVPFADPALAVLLSGELERMSSPPAYRSALRLAARIAAM